MSLVQRRSGLTMGMIRRYWLNETGEVQLEALGALAQLLNVKPGDLLTDEPKQEKNVRTQGKAKRGRRSKATDN